MEELQKLGVNKALLNVLSQHIIDRINTQALRALSERRVFDYADAVGAIKQAFNEINHDEQYPKKAITNHSA